MAATPVRDTSHQTQRPHQVDEAVDLGGRAGDLEHEAGMRWCPRTRARKASAMRSASTRLSPLPATLTSAISRSMPAFWRGPVGDAWAGTSRRSWASICSITSGVPQVTMVMREVCAADRPRPRSGFRYCSRGRRTGRRRAPARRLHCPPAPSWCGVRTSSHRRALHLGVVHRQTSIFPSSLIFAAVIGRQDHLVMRRARRDHRIAILVRVDAAVEQHRLLDRRSSPGSWRPARRACSARRPTQPKASASFTKSGSASE